MNKYNVFVFYLCVSFTDKAMVNTSAVQNIRTGLFKRKFDFTTQVLSRLREENVFSGTQSRTFCSVQCLKSEACRYHVIRNNACILLCVDGLTTVSECLIQRRSKICSMSYQFVTEQMAIYLTVFTLKIYLYDTEWCMLYRQHVKTCVDAHKT